MDKKSDAGRALRLFCEEFGVPEKLTFDGSKEQCGKGTEFMKQIHQHGIDYHISEPERHNENPVEGVIRELQKRWHRVMVRKRVPIKLWNYGFIWVSETNSMTITSDGGIEKFIPLTQVTGDMVDISEYLDFGFYDRVWYKENAGLGPENPGIWLGISHRTGRLMCYYVLTQKGTVLSRTNVQRVTNLELQVESIKKIFDEFDKEISQYLNEDRGYEGSKPKPEDWEDLIEEDPEFSDDFQSIFSDPEIPEADENTPEVLEDTYLNMEIAVPRDSDGPEFAKVTKRLRDSNGLPIGKANENPVLDTRVYEVEYADGYKASLSANTIALNMFSQVDEEGNRHVLFDQIIDHRVDGSELKHMDAFIESKNGGRCRKETTRGWELLVQWKDGSTSWECLKDMKNCYPVQVAEFSIQSNISREPAFAWWVPHVIKKRDRIIGKVKSKYWVRTHKYGIRIPKSVKQARGIDQDNQNTLWWDAICTEMKNVRVAFEVFEGDENNTPKVNQKIDCHMIFDVKLVESLRRKARMVAGGHKTETPSALTYSSVVSRDSVRISLTIAALNDLKVLACDIQNAYLTANPREKVYTIAGPEFGS